MVSVEVGEGEAVTSVVGGIVAVGVSVGAGAVGVAVAVGVMTGVALSVGVDVIVLVMVSVMGAFVVTSPVIMNVCSDSSGFTPAKAVCSWLTASKTMAMHTAIQQSALRWRVSSGVCIA